MKLNRRWQTPDVVTLPLMDNKHNTVLIMAGGTGGHIFPALSIAEKLRQLDVHVEWLGSDAGLERELLAGTSIPLHLIAARGLRGKSLRNLLLAPFMLVRATWQALGVIGRVNPDCVLGMGGFVTGPGGIAAKLRGRPLLIHEQNAVPGVTNRLLALLASQVLEAFPGTFRTSPGRVVTVGNPVRRGIAGAAAMAAQSATGRPLQVLVMGGSQGAQALNEVMPQALAVCAADQRPQVLHQAGKGKAEATRESYRQRVELTGDSVQVVEFIDDMETAFRWADLVICRSGASTVAELAAAGLPAVLVPYPYHKDQQQLKNARWLAEAGAAIIIEQKDLSPDLLRDTLSSLAADRERLVAMAGAANRIAVINADERIARICLEVANG